MELHKNTVQLHAEVVQKNTSAINKQQLADAVRSLLLNLDSINTVANLPSNQLEMCPIVRRHVDSIMIYGKDDDNEIINPKEALISLYVYKLQLDEGGMDILNTDEESGSPAAERWPLPSFSFHGLWENLVYDSDIKKNSLNFVITSLLFADKGVNPNLIDLNKVVLFHGPPGTGKTSLCKALAQKLAIRLNYRYKRAQLVEINSHSLFSKWYSESGKLVFKLFEKVREIVEDSDCLVFVLIDEIESLAQARNAAFSGSEPFDSIRVVNAVLTQLDKIKRYPNVLILTTSNMSGAIDLAFVDRADLKYLIALPSDVAIYKIYLSCLVELMRTEIISPRIDLLTYEALKLPNIENNKSYDYSMKLLNLAKLSKGLSGRTLRKIPFLAHVSFTKCDAIDLNAFFKAMASTVTENLMENEIFCNGIKKLEI